MSEREKALEAAAKAVLYHDERGQGTGYAEAMDILRAALAMPAHDLAAEVLRLREALHIADSWLERWAQHVTSSCASGVCTCGLERVRLDVLVALGDSHD
jgi:hypothetical protein